MYPCLNTFEGSTGWCAEWCHCELTKCIRFLYAVDAFLVVSASRRRSFGTCRPSEHPQENVCAIRAVRAFTIPPSRRLSIVSTRVVVVFDPEDAEPHNPCSARLREPPSFAGDSGSACGRIS